MTDDAPLAAAKHDKPTGLAARAVTINQPVDEVYSRFRDFAAWPAFMENVVRIDGLVDRDGARGKRGRLAVFGGGERGVIGHGGSFPIAPSMAGRGAAFRGKTVR